MLLDQLNDYKNVVYHDHDVGDYNDDNSKNCRHSSDINKYYADLRFRA